MLRSNTRSYDEIRKYINEIPVIETHEHYIGEVRTIEDVIGFLLGNYYYSDFESAAFGEEKEISDLWLSGHTKLSFEDRYKIFNRIYKKSNKTAYARGLQVGLKECWGIEDIDSPEKLKKLELILKDRKQDLYYQKMDKFGIKAKIVNISDMELFQKIIGGEASNVSKYCRFAFPLPSFHDIHNKQDIYRLEKYIDRTITCLEDYLESFEIFFKKCVDFGIVCIKDQSAYRRKIEYSNPSRSEAEKAFNDIISNPRDVYGDDRVRVLDDWLFHYFMRSAVKYRLPVQLHTGHMAGIRNDIVKTNAADLTSVIELHQDVRFDLFHGNWPYMDEYLFLGKNYPNVWLDLCWVQIIDPLYSIELMKRAVMTVSHTKIFAFGGDTGDIEWTVGYLVIARDNVACALSELVDSGWLKIYEAEEIAKDWFFNNPNEFFKLGFDRI